MMTIHQRNETSLTITQGDKIDKVNFEEENELNKVHFVKFEQKDKLSLENDITCSFFNSNLVFFSFSLSLPSF